MRYLAMLVFLYACVLDDRAKAWFALGVAAFLVMWDIAATLDRRSERKQP